MSWKILLFIIPVNTNDIQHLQAPFRLNKLNVYLAAFLCFYQKIPYSFSRWLFRILWLGRSQFKSDSFTEGAFRNHLCIRDINILPVVIHPQDVPYPSGLAL